MIVCVCIKEKALAGKYRENNHVILLTPLSYGPLSLLLFLRCEKQSVHELGQDGYQLLCSTVLTEVWNCVCILITSRQELSRLITRPCTTPGLWRLTIMTLIYIVFTTINGHFHTMSPPPEIVCIDLYLWPIYLLSKQRCLKPPVDD